MQEDCHSLPGRCSLYSILGRVPGRVPGHVPGRVPGRVSGRVPGRAPGCTLHSFRLKS